MTLGRSCAPLLEPLDSFFSFFFSLPFSPFLRVFCFRSRCRCDYYISFFSLGFFTKCAACLRAACADCGGTSTSTLCDSFKHRTGQLYMIKWYHLVYISWYSRHIHFSSRVLYLITVENVNNARHTRGEGHSTSWNEMPPSFFYCIFLSLWTD